jgi:hypothetical protein
LPLLDLLPTLTPADREIHSANNLRRPLLTVLLPHLGHVETHGRRTYNKLTLDM